MQVGDLVKYKDGSTGITGVVVRQLPNKGFEILFTDGQRIEYEQHYLLYLEVV